MNSFEERFDEAWNARMKEECLAIDREIEGADYRLENLREFSDAWWRLVDLQYNAAASGGGDEAEEAIS